MIIFDEFGIFTNFLFLEVVTLAYLINNQSVADNVGILRYFWLCLSVYFTTPTFVVQSLVNTSKPSQAKYNFFLSDYLTITKLVKKSHIWIQFLNQTCVSKL